MVLYIIVGWKLLEHINFGYLNVKTQHYDLKILKMIWEIKISTIILPTFYKTYRVKYVPIFYCYGTASHFAGLVEKQKLGDPASIFIELSYGII